MKATQVQHNTCYTDVFKCQWITTHTNCTNHIFKPLTLPKYLFYCCYPYKHTAKIQH